MSHLQRQLPGKTWSQRLAIRHGQIKFQYKKCNADGSQNRVAIMSPPVRVLLKTAVLQTSVNHKKRGFDNLSVGKSDLLSDTPALGSSTGSTCRCPATRGLIVHWSMSMHRSGFPGFRSSPDQRIGCPFVRFCCIR